MSLKLKQLLSASLVFPENKKWFDKNSIFFQSTGHTSGFQFLAE